MPTERRKAYRVSPTGDNAMQAEITGENENAVGKVLDVSLMGATVLIATSPSPTFAIGELVDAHFQSAPTGHIEVQAKIQSRSELDDSRRFGLTFIDSDALRAKLNIKLLRLFNQREAFRVEPSAATPVEIRMCAEGSEVACGPKI